MSAFVVGDVVTLKSGGERMTVTEIVGDTITTSWIPKNGTLQFQHFSPDVLIKVVKIPPHLMNEILDLLV